MNNKFIIAAFLCIITTLGINAQNTYTGSIIDNLTGEPLVGATISNNNEYISETDYLGEFKFESHNVSSFVIEYIGYTEKEVPATEMNGTITLETSPVLINQVIVSANRDEKVRSEAPIAISTVTPQLLQETKPTRLDEILNKVTGVNMVDLGNEQHTMSIRQPINFKGLFLYLEDGVPIRPTGVFNHNALLEMNMANLRRIEVIRGPSSSLYGSEAIGGAINFITLKPSKVATARVGIQGNNNGYRRTDFNTSNTFGKLGLGVSGYYAQRRDGYLDHSDYNKAAVTVKGDYNIDENNKISLDATYIDYYADMGGSLDSTYFYSKNYVSQQTFTNREVDALRTKLTYNHTTDNSRTTLVGFARQNSIRQNPSYRIKDDKSWSNPTGDANLAHSEENESKVNSVGFIAQHKQSLDILSGLNITVGASLDNSPNQYKSNYISVVKSNDGKYTDYTSHPDSVLSDYKVDILNVGAYANVDLKITDRLQFTGALRYDVLNYDFKNNLDENAFSGAPDDIDNFTALTPKLGLTYDLGNNNGLFANYSIGILPPGVGELYRGVKIPTLQPSKYINYELGGWFQVNKVFSMDGSIYWMDGRNEIISVKLDDGSRENRNAGKTRHYGIEYGVNAKITTDLSLRVSGTNAKHEFVDYIESGTDYSGNEMGQAPSWIANSELTYKPSFAKGLRTSIEWQHIDSYFMDNGNTKEYDGHNVFNFRVGYDFKNIEIWTNIMNIGNRLYSTSARSSRWGDSYSVGEPRAFNIGLAYNFQGK